MAYISQATIRELNQRLDALAVIGEYVRLDRKGGRYWGLCPFHNEKTPSFTVNPDTKLYHCFGCGKGGSVISFVMEIDKLSFPEVVEQLARPLGLEIIYENSQGDGGDDRRNERKEQLFDLYHRLAASFHHCLMEKVEGKAAKEYILSRGIKTEMVEQFRLGYAPADRRWLFKFLSQKGYSEEFLSSSGLFSSRYPGLPLFADRLMFPIADRQGREVAFSGRILSSRDPKAPKYINSPELETYRKGQTLYALDLALQEIRKTKAVYVVEGNMDVIAMHQAGVTNAVAPLGTALTEDQVKLLRRWVEKARLLFDADEAGQNAAVKGILTCRRNGLPCEIVIPENPASEDGGISPENGAKPKDPADILKKFGPEALKNRMKYAIMDFEYLIIRAKSLYDISGSEGKTGAVAFLFPYFAALESEVSRDACIETAANAFGVGMRALLNDYRRFQAGQAGMKTSGRGTGLRLPKEGFPKASHEPQVRMNDELILLAAIAVHDMAAQSAEENRLYPKFRNALAIKEIEDPAAKELYIAMEECFSRDEYGMDNLLSRVSLEALRNFIVERGTSKEFSVNPAKFVEDGIKRFTLKRLERQKDGIVNKLRTLKTGASKADAEITEELLLEKMRIDTELRRLKEDNQ